MTQTPHRGARDEFLEFLERKADDYGTTITRLPENLGYKREGDFIARFRSTTEQSYGTFQTTDPKTDRENAEFVDDTDRFDTYLIVVLNLAKDYRFQSPPDNYYPLTFGQFDQFTGGEHASGRYQANIQWDDNIMERRCDDPKKALQCGSVEPDGENPLQDIVRESEDIDPD